MPTRKTLARRALFAAAATGWTIGAQAADTEGSLTLTFAGLKSSNGSVMAAMFDSEAKYAAAGGDGAVARRKIAIAGNMAMVVIDGIKPGRYAIKAFHDLDGSGQLKLNLFGIPTVPVAFSNNAPVRGKMPNWNETSFEIKPGPNKQTINVD